MAAATLKKGARFDGSKLYDHVVSYLPSYARPRFIRLQVIQSKPASLYLDIGGRKCKQTGFCSAVNAAVAVISPSDVCVLFSLVSEFSGSHDYF